MKLPHIPIDKKTVCSECGSDVELNPQPLFSDMIDRFERWFKFFAQGTYPAERVIDLVICAVQEEGDFVISDHIAKEQMLRETMRRAKPTYQKATPIEHPLLSKIPGKEPEEA